MIVNCSLHVVYMWKTVSHLFPEEEKNESHLFGRQWFSATKYETQNLLLKLANAFKLYRTFQVKEGFFLFNKIAVTCIQGSILFFSTSGQLVQCAR